MHQSTSPTQTQIRTLSSRSTSLDLRTVKHAPESQGPGKKKRKDPASPLTACNALNVREKEGQSILFNPVRLICKNYPAIPFERGIERCARLDHSEPEQEFKKEPDTSVPEGILQLPLRTPAMHQLGVPPRPTWVRPRQTRRGRMFQKEPARFLPSSILHSPLNTWLASKARPTQTQSQPVSSQCTTSAAPIRRGDAAAKAPTSRSRFSTIQDRST
jgi:hypothetical protein